MRRLLSVFLISIALVAIACSSNASEPTEKGLEERAKVLFDAMGNEKWLDVYRFNTLQFKEVCSARKFAEISAENLAQMKEPFNLDDDERFEFRVVDVRVEGRNGIVATEILFKGDVLFTASLSDDNAVTLEFEFIDGKWFVNDEFPEKFCE